MNELNSTMAAVPVLHNMSCRPTVTLQHKGIDQCRRIRLGRRVFPMANPTSVLRYWCAALGLDATDDTRLASLLRTAVASVPKLEVFPAVVVARQWSGSGEAIPGISDDPLLSVAVVARTAGGVFIRHKSPLISGQALNDPVTLFLPKNWRYEP